MEDLSSVQGSPSVRERYPEKKVDDMKKKKEDGAF